MGAIDDVVDSGTGDPDDFVDVPILDQQTEEAAAEAFGGRER